MSVKVLKGNIVYTPTKERFRVYRGSYIVLQDNCIQGIYEKLPEEYSNLECVDYKNQIIIPALVDLHVHAPQFAFRGIGMDKELLEWLETYTFKEEAKFIDLTYARKIYSRFAQTMRKSGTTRAVVFATIHKDATYILMEELEKHGIEAYVGKVNMDRNCPDTICEETNQSIADTRAFIEYTNKHFKSVKPIVTPRFIPTCTNQLLEGLEVLMEEYAVPVQSHLSENKSEIKWVNDLCPEAKGYADAYNQYGMLGTKGKSIMAHCVHLSEDEMTKMAIQDVIVAHCPNSNTNLSSGVTPVRQLLNQGIKVGLGSDIAGGYAISIFRAMSDAIGISKIQMFLSDKKDQFLSVSEAFYLGTNGGINFFTDKNAFEIGSKFHALVIDDESLGDIEDFSLEERIERIIHLSDDRHIVAIYQGTMHSII